MGAGRVVPSGYSEQVRQIAPPQLHDRGTELRELTRFCLEPNGCPYVWWRARAWAGKSALMSWFVLHPPPQVTVISFFITARWQGHNDHLAFTDAVLEQLAHLLDEPMPAFLTPTTRGPHLMRMLAQAAGQCREHSQRLVLVVDGLDEDQGVTTGPDAHSIAALLPAWPPDGLRIIVAGRPNPPIPSDVVDYHPLRDPSIVRTLAASPSAAVIKSDMQRELRRLLQGSDIEQDLLGLITAAGGGLSASDLAHLSGRSVYEVDQNLHAVTGRTFTSRASFWQPGTASPVYVLGHEELQSAAANALGPDMLGRYRERLHIWADAYRHQNWPPDTPEYLLGGYFSILKRTGDLPRMIGCATDRGRHDRMLDVTGGDIAALTEITSTQDLILHLDEPDLTVMARLAVHRSRLTDRNTRLPASLPVTWALIGNPDRAEALARSITDQDRQTEALADLALVVAQAGDTDRAEALARSITDQDRQTETLVNLALAVAQARDTGRAEVLARSITDPGPRAQALAGLVLVAAQTRDANRATALACHAETAARSIADPGRQAQALADLALAVAQAGDTDRATGPGPVDYRPVPAGTSPDRPGKGSGAGRGHRPGYCPGPVDYRPVPAGTSPDRPGKGSGAGRGHRPG